MGFLSNVLLQAVITSVVLGALRRAGVLRIDPNAIENESARNIFTNAVEFGEAVAEKGERVIKEFSFKK